jgi:hypothetical protein
LSKMANLTHIYVLHKLSIKIPQHFFRYKYFGATCFQLINKIDCVYRTNVSLIPEWELRLMWAEKVLETSKRCFKMPKTGITANLIASQDSSEESCIQTSYFMTSAKCDSD